MVPLNPKDQSASPTPTVNLSTSNSSLMPAVTNQNPPLFQLLQLSPTKFPNSSLTRSNLLQLSPTKFPNSSLTRENLLQLSPTKFPNSSLTRENLLQLSPTKFPNSSLT